MFIVLEGLDGVGKTTHQKLLAEKLNNTITFKDPGSSPVGEKIRQILLFDKLDLAAETEITLFMAARAQLRKDIANAVVSGKVVIMDRYYPSTYAYQNITIDQLKVLKSITCIEPDLKILLMGVRDKHMDREDRFESRDARFRHQAGQKYLDLSMMESNWVSINSDGPIEQTQESILKEIENRFPKLRRAND